MVTLTACKIARGYKKNEDGRAMPTSSSFSAILSHIFLALFLLVFTWTTPSYTMKKHLTDDQNRQEATPKKPGHLATDILSIGAHGTHPIYRLSQRHYRALPVPTGYATTATSMRIWSWLRACILPADDDHPNQIPTTQTSTRRNPEKSATTLLQEIIATTLGRPDLWPHDQEISSIDPLSPTDS